MDGFGDLDRNLFPCPVPLLCSLLLPAFLLPFQTRFYVAQVGPQLAMQLVVTLILLPPLPECWDHRTEPPYPVLCRAKDPAHGSLAGEASSLPTEPHPQLLEHVSDGQNASCVWLSKAAC